MIQSPLNNVVVKVKTKYHKNFSNMMKRANLNPGSQVNPADYVQIFGEVVSVPKTISNRLDYKGYTAEDIRVGDTAIFRYDVIYSFLENVQGDAPLYANMVWFKGQEYFMADIQKVFGVIRDGEIIMINGYCMVEEMSVPSALILPNHLKNVIQASSAILSHIGKPLSHQKCIQVERGDIVYYNPGLIQRYEINDKVFGILSQRHILGRKMASYADIQRII